jgi:hypothetical protein
VELDDEPVAPPLYVAVGCDDRANAEWRAIDQAPLVG